MDKISKKEVEHIAELARIKLTKEELGKFQKELSSILDYVNKLSKVDTSKIKPTAQVTGLKEITREDKSEKRDKNLREKILDQAPSRKKDHFKVPKILE